jgi:SAM-dependent methyltransferase
MRCLATASPGSVIPPGTKSRYSLRHGANMTDARRSAPHVARNAGPIADVLRETLPAEGLVLEVASGTGEHVLHFARAFPHVVWQPSDPDPAALRSIEAWRAEAGLANLLPALALDARAPDWPVERTEAILCINMAHISPWAATAGLMRGAGRLLGEGAPLFLYGPFRRAGVETAPSNEAFDASLRARDPEWGLRNLEDVVADAESNGLRLDRVVEMPANNLSVVFRKDRAATSG